MSSPEEIFRALNQRTVTFDTILSLVENVTKMLENLMRHPRFNNAAIKDLERVLGPLKKLYEDYQKLSDKKREQHLANIRAKMKKFMTSLEELSQKSYELLSEVLEGSPSVTMDPLTQPNYPDVTSLVLPTHSLPQEYSRGPVRRHTGLYSDWANRNADRLPQLGITRPFEYCGPDNNMSNVPNINVENAQRDRRAETIESRGLSGNVTHRPTFQDIDGGRLNPFGDVNVTERLTSMLNLTRRPINPARFTDQELSFPFDRTPNITPGPAMPDHDEARPPPQQRSEPERMRLQAQPTGGRAPPAINTDRRRFVMFNPTHLEPVLQNEPFVTHPSAKHNRPQDAPNHDFGNLNHPSPMSVSAALEQQQAPERNARLPYISGSSVFNQQREGGSTSAAIGVIERDNAHNVGGSSQAGSSTLAQPSEIRQTMTYVDGEDNEDDMYCSA